MQVQQLTYKQLQAVVKEMKCLMSCYKVVKLNSKREVLEQIFIEASTRNGQGYRDVAQAANMTSLTEEEKCQIVKTSRQVYTTAIEASKAKAAIATKEYLENADQQVLTHTDNYTGDNTTRVTDLAPALPTVKCGKTWVMVYAPACSLDNKPEVSISQSNKSTVLLLSRMPSFPDKDETRDLDEPAYTPNHKAKLKEADGIAANFVHFDSINRVAVGDRKLEAKVSLRDQEFMAGDEEGFHYAFVPSCLLPSFTKATILQDPLDALMAVSEPYTEAMSADDDDLTAGVVLDNTDLETQLAANYTLWSRPNVVEVVSFDDILKLDLAQSEIDQIKEHGGYRSDRKETYALCCSLWVEGVEGVHRGDHYPGQAVYPDWDESYTCESYLNSYCELACEIDPQWTEKLIPSDIYDWMGYGVIKWSQTGYTTLLDDGKRRHQRNIMGSVIYVSVDSGLTYEEYRDVHLRYFGCGSDLHITNRYNAWAGNLNGQYCEIACNLGSKPVDPLDLEYIEPSDRRTTNLTFEIDGKVDLVQHVAFSAAVKSVNRIFDKAANKGYDLVLYIGGRHYFDHGHYDWWKVDGMTIFSTTEPTIEYKPLAEMTLTSTQPRAWLEIRANGKFYCAKCDQPIGACQCDLELAAYEATKVKPPILLSEAEFNQLCDEHGFTVTPAVKDALSDTTAHYRVTRREPLLVAAINNTYDFLTSKSVTTTLRSACFWTYASLCVLWAMVQLGWQGIRLATSRSAIALYNTILTTTLLVICTVFDWLDTRWLLLWNFLDSAIALVIGLLPQRKPTYPLIHYFLD